MVYFLLLYIFDYFLSSHAEMQHKRIYTTSRLVGRNLGTLRIHCLLVKMNSSQVRRKTSCIEDKYFK